MVIISFYHLLVIVIIIWVETYGLIIGLHLFFKVQIITVLHIIFIILFILLIYLPRIVVLGSRLEV